jgi:glycosyltransferase involved in cell wall biosynthesis
LTACVGKIIIRGDMSVRWKIAYLAFPLPYGLYTVYRHLRKGLEPFDIELRWVGSGQSAYDAWHDPQWASEQKFGEYVQGPYGDEMVEGPNLARHIVAHGYDAVVINPPSFRHELNIVRYLPAKIRRLAQQHSIATGVYRLMRALREHVHASVGVSPRIRKDLIAYHGFDPNSTFAVPNALDLRPYSELNRQADAATVRLLSFGRIEETAKGVFWLPQIMQRLSGVDVRLSIAGAGPDLPRLKQLCEPLGDRVKFLGVVPPVEIPRLVSEHDVFIMPSRYEGFGYTIVEAMAGSCVPVVSRIADVTDYIVKDGVSGLLFPVGDVDAAAGHIASLARDRVRLRQMAAVARQECFERFSIDRVAAEFVAVIEHAMKSEHVIPEPLPLEQWNYTAGLQTPWYRRLLPNSLKNILRRFIR